MASSGDEEKKEADEEVAGGGGIGRSISEQRAARLRRRRGGAGGGKDSRSGADRDAVAEERAPAGTVAAAADNCEGADGDAEGYTSAYTAVRQKYSHHVSMMERGDGSGLSKALNYRHDHRRERVSREARGVKLIGQRWKSQLNPRTTIAPRERNVRRRIGNLGVNYDSDGSGETCDGSADDAIEQPNTMQPTLVYRRTDASYTETLKCNSMTFLNDQNILYVDQRCDLQIVGLPLSLSDEKGRDNDSANAGVGVGKLPVRTSIVPELPSDKPLPLSQELFGYKNGDRFAIGLSRGRMRLFATEKMEGDGWIQNERMSDNLGTCHGVLSCLALQQPLRRYKRMENTRYQPGTTFSLASMLSLDPRDVLERFNCTRPEYHWDDPFEYSGSGARWAFREGGVGGGSGTALLGACVDRDLDCFSLRVIDERMCSSSGSGGSSWDESSQVFVDMSGQDSDDVTGLCFSGEHGMVTSHERWHGTKAAYDKPSWPGAYDRTNNLPTESILKWWDHRMLRNQPVAAMMLPPFPRNGVSGVSPDNPEYSLSGYSCSGEQCDGGVTCACEQMLIRPSNRNDQPPGSREKTKLIGGRDASDHFAILSRGRHRQLLIVDSPRREVLRRERLPGTKGRDFWVSCSSNLDFLASYELSDRVYYRQQEPDRLSLFDISRHRNHHSDESCMSGEKRRYDCLDSTGASGKENCGLLGRSRPKFPDMYGIDSQLSCIALNESGSQLACGTKDGDIFVMQPGLQADEP